MLVTRHSFVSARKRKEYHSIEDISILSLILRHLSAPVNIKKSAPFNRLNQTFRGHERKIAIATLPSSCCLLKRLSRLITA